MKQRLAVLLILGVASLLALMFTAIILLLVAPSFSYECHQNYDNAKYKILTGCYVEYEGEYIPEKLYNKALKHNIITD